MSVIVLDAANVGNFAQNGSHARYSGVNVTLGFCAVYSSSAFNVASCLASGPHHIMLRFLGSSLGAAGSALLSTTGAGVLFGAVLALLLPQAAINTSAAINNNIKPLDTDPWIFMSFPPRIIFL